MVAALEAPFEVSLVLTVGVVLEDPSETVSGVALEEAPLEASFKVPVELALVDALDSLDIPLEAPLPEERP